MNWETMTIGKKIAFGFGLILVLLGIVGFISFSGVGDIVRNAKTVIQGNKVDGKLAQNEVDHLNWAGKVNALITDDTITELQVETNDHKCGFGKWLHGEGRKEAERLFPSIVPLLKKIEEPHRKLHMSAIEIGKVFQQADVQLPALLTKVEVDHLVWASNIRNALLSHNDSLGVQTDPKQCALGKWLTSHEAKKVYDSGDSDFKKAWDKMTIHHDKLHKSATNIEKNLAYGRLSEIHSAQAQLVSDCNNYLKEIMDILNNSMEEIVDPAKAVAKEALDAVTMAKWDKIDRDMNKNIVQPFMEIRMLIATLTAVNVNNQWPVYKDKFNQFQDKVSAWSELVNSNPDLEEMAVAITHKGYELAKNAEKLRRNLLDENEAKTSIETANGLFQKVTTPLLNETLTQLKCLITKSSHNLAGLKKAKDIYATQTTPTLHAVQELLGNVRTEIWKHIMTDEAMLTSAQGTKRNVTIVSLVALIAGIALALLIAKGIVAVLKKVSQHLEEGAEQVAAASTQVSSASQSLAEGASEQAAAIEETSSSIEEMSAMTRQNASNADQADVLMKEAKTITSLANKSMNELTISMAEISKASKDTSKIIKTIDEIAFQTNLLALNAAVEAARAGEAGSGFAVVADEVRNLAMRAAEAAQNTATLIEGTVKKVASGSDLVTKTNEDFGQVAESSAKVAGLISEIAAASNEQSRGLEQVSTAMVDMDKVTQQNAANAEESASSSEELSAQAEQMKNVVKDLMHLVGGHLNGNHTLALYGPSAEREGTGALLGLENTIKHLTAPRTKVQKPGHVSPRIDDGDF